MPSLNRISASGTPRPPKQASGSEADAWLAQFVETRDEALRERLILHHAPLARYLATRFVNRGVPLEDLVQVGTIGLIGALDRYDPQHGARFVTYALPSITGDLKRYFRDLNWHIKA